ncbi:MAG: CopG family transcriptional regulator [Fervidicoccaceae archaeon]|jgi:predicted DNA-binding protein|uniref:CopG family transcriptional regulator n=1 Tax=Fervidicoccus fontis TaxID=683846 RepID=A0A7C2YJZ2_9CREN|nr:MAG: CopG family transcriptional regulator [Fervidicoccus sp.]HEU98011.1 CopG family transcriptional regulator [Fervidicoccus fontis]
MSVFSVKLKKEIREKMEKYREKVNWADEVRKFIEEKLKELEAEENFSHILEELRKGKWKVTRGFAIKSVREDRDSS